MLLFRCEKLFIVLFEVIIFFNVCVLFMRILMEEKVSKFLSVWIKDVVRFLFFVNVLSFVGMNLLEK